MTLDLADWWFDARADTPRPTFNHRMDGAAWALYALECRLAGL